ncbi:MAG: hypothetical protein Q8R33_13240 [Burkholderiales bacterium]|nr:hypothetical protein [Burkholderiales bacterium]
MNIGQLFAAGNGLGTSLRQGALLGAAVLVLTLPPAASGRWSASRTTDPVDASLAAPRVADFRSHAASPDARRVADWIAASQDNQRLPFVILDKRDAKIFVFDAGGRLLDASPVLLGAAPGDDSVVGIGQRPIEQVRPEERTTPAGRFVSSPGRNASGEDVVWVDYDAAVSMHRVRPIDPKERRLERLASDDPAQRRISYGCINVPIAFFERVVQPAMGQGRGVVYVLPETRALHEVFAGTRPPGTASASTRTPAPSL